SNCLYLSRFGDRCVGVHTTPLGQVDRKSGVNQAGIKCPTALAGRRRAVSDCGRRYRTAVGDAQMGPVAVLTLGPANASCLQQLDSGWREERNAAAGADRGVPA